MKHFSSLALCSIGVVLGFSHPTWWGITGGVICALGVIANICLIIKEATENERSK